MAGSILMEQELSVYETPKIDVVEIATQDIVRTSPEGGTSFEDGWI